MSLAEYFTNQGQFAQSEYLLYAALKIIPDSDDELRCMVNTAVGHYYQHMLSYLVRHFMDETPITQEEETLIHKKTVEFPTVDVKWP